MLIAKVHNKTNSKVIIQKNAGHEMVRHQKKETDRISNEAYG